MVFINAKKEKRFEIVFQMRAAIEELFCNRRKNKVNNYEQVRSNGANVSKN